MVIRRGEIWWADLGMPSGSEPGLRRPVVIVSDDRFNASQLGTVTAVALTSTMRLAGMPGNVALPAEVTGLPRAATVNVTQAVTIDRLRLEERMVELPLWVMTQIDEGLRLALAL